MLILYTPLPSRGQRLVPPRKYHSDDEEDHAADYADDVDEEEFVQRNATGTQIRYFHNNKIRC